MLSFLSGVCIYLTIGILFTIIVEILSLMGKTLNMRQITMNNISKLKDNHDKELAKTRINRIIFKTYIQTKMAAGARKPE